MVVKKSVHPRPPPVHPGLDNKIRQAEEAEQQGTTPANYDAAQRIIRPSLDAPTKERAEQARTVGLVEPAYKEGVDGRQVLAEHEAFLPGVDLDRAWDGLSEAEKIRAGATERFRLEMDALLRQSAMPYQLPHKIAGRLDGRALRRTEENLRHELDAYDYLLAKDVRSLLDQFIGSTRQLIELGLKQRAFMGIDSVVMNEVLTDLVRKLVYQELTNKRRAMGERGVRRIISVLSFSERMFANTTLDANALTRMRWLLRLVHVHADLGHTAYAARVSVRGSRLHRAYGARIFLDEQNRYRHVFTQDELELAQQAVATHSSLELPFETQPLLAAVRAADHLSPFIPIRVYKVLEGHADLEVYLQDLLAHARRGDREGYGRVRAAFREKLLVSELAPPLRDDVWAAMRPLEREVELVELGELAGDVSTIVQKGNSVSVTVRHDPFAARYQALFDFQQEQLVRVAKGVGVDLTRGEAPFHISAPASGVLSINLTH